jgi:rhomboid family GlyGly-CTERM serine protease
VLLHLTPDLTAWATFDRTAIAAGQLWRLITGHWTHWSGEHLGWDLLVFAVGGGALELRGRRGTFLTCTVLSALLISGGVWVLRPEMVEYRGLSGIDCALVTLIAVDLLRQSLRDRRWSLSLALTGLLAGYLGKVIFELVTGQALFVDGQGLFVPVPLAHVLGGAVGIALGLTTPAEPRSGTGELRGVDPQTPQLLLEALPVQTQLPGCARHVAAVLAEGGAQDLSLESLNQALLRRGEVLPLLPHDQAGRGPRGGGGAELGGEVAGLDDAPSAEDGGPLDGVAQLTDVARPGVGSEGGLGIGGQPQGTG